MKNDQLDISKSSTTAVKKKAAKSTKAATTKKPKKFLKFFKDLKAEIKKVVWPTKKVVVNNTGIVLAAMFVSGIFIWGIDTGFKFLFDLILKR